MFPLLQFKLQIRNNFWLKQMTSHGEEARVLRAKRRCAGVLSIPSDGVFLKFSSGRWGSWPASVAFLKLSFAVLTLFSALPLDYWYRGEELICSNWYSATNFWNSFKSNCGPLSVVIRSRSQCLARCGFSLPINPLAVLDVSISNTKKLE